MIKAFIVSLAAVFALEQAARAAPEPESARTVAAPNAAVALKGVETGDINRDIDACSDFYEFANGAWRMENPIPASMSRWSRRVAAHEANQQRVRSLLEDVSRRKDWPTGSVEKLVGDHYASCMDTSANDAAGLAPLASLLAEIDAVRSIADVQGLISRLHDLAVFVPFATMGAPDYHEPANFIENIVGGRLGLPDRDYYLKEEPRFVDARATYLKHVANVLTLGGMRGARAAEAAASIFALEKRFAEASLDGVAAADQAGTDHKMSFAQLEKLAPHFDWRAYFDEAKLPRIDLNVAEPRLVRQFDSELRVTPVAIWRLYLKWHLLDSALPWLSAPFAEESFQFSDHYLGKAAAMKPRAELCAASVEALLGGALGKIYVQRYFPPAAKAKAQEIARNLRSAPQDEVVAVQWMDPRTKTRALEKLADTNVQMGYPDKWQDYSSVTIRRRGAFWANVAAGRRFGVEDDRQQVGKPTNRDLWALAPSSPDAYLDLQLNKLVLPAGFLQPPYFNPNASDAVNYGAFGIGLAHDLTHAIDASGSEIDIMGRPQAWWTETDRGEFAKRGQCIVDQFEDYFIEPGIHHDGKRVLSESIADLAGVQVAYRALRKSMQSHPIPALDGFTPEQQFFISWGQSSGAAMRMEAQRQLISDDPHPVPKFRVIGPLANSPEFQQAFACKAGAAMVRQPERRCEVW